MELREILQTLLPTSPHLLGSLFDPLFVPAVSRIDRCIHYSGVKSFVNNGFHESFLGSWLQRETRVPT